MRFTAQEEYGLRCLLQIARAREGALNIPEIARAEGLSTAHVAKIMRLLRRAGLVTSTRGLRGGYRLARAADTVSVHDVLQALGGAIFSEQFCGRYSGTRGVCVHDPDCSMRPMWMALDAAVRGALGGLRLHDLLRSEEEMNAWAAGNVVPIRIESKFPSAARGERL